VVVHKDPRTCMSPSPISYPDFVSSKTTLLPKADLSGADLGAVHLFHANLGKAVLVTTYLRDVGKVPRGQPCASHDTDRR
jgi:hypothetical protein